MVFFEVLSAYFLTSDLHRQTGPAEGPNIFGAGAISIRRSCLFLSWSKTEGMKPGGTWSLHTVILSDRTFKIWALSSFAFNLSRYS